MNETWFSAEGSALVQILFDFIWFDSIWFDDRRRTEQYHGLPALDIIDGENKRNENEKKDGQKRDSLLWYVLSACHITC